MSADSPAWTWNTSPSRGFLSVPKTCPVTTAHGTSLAVYGPGESPDIITAPASFLPSWANQTKRFLPRGGATAVNSAVLLGVFADPMPVKLRDLTPVNGSP